MVSFYFKANLLLCIFLILFSMSKIISFVSRALEDAIDLIEFAFYFFAHLQFILERTLFYFSLRKNFSF